MSKISEKLTLYPPAIRLINIFPIPEGEHMLILPITPNQQLHFLVLTAKIMPQNVRLIDG